MRTQDQHRKCLPLGSVFVGAAAQNRSLAGAALCLLPTMVAQLAKKGFEKASKSEVGMPHRATIRQRTAKNCTKLATHHQNGTECGP